MSGAMAKNSSGCSGWRYGSRARCASARAGLSTADSSAGTSTAAADKDVNNRPVNKARVTTDMADSDGECPTITRMRSEEHTSELQSLMRISYAVFCLKKKKKKINLHRTETH